MGLLPPGSGKALALDTPIPTPDGWTEMGKLRIGDYVFGTDGKPCQVTWVSPVWKKRPVYAITTDCGDRIVADAEHEWEVILCRKPDYRKVSIKTSKQLAKPRNKRPLIERGKAIELPEKDLIIDPYVLGAWLGDGSTLFPNISCGGKDQEWLCAEFCRLGLKLSINKRGDNFSITLLGARKYFRELGMMGGSCGIRAKTKLWGRKFIPEVYMRGSITQRMSLLQGLIDTDGHVSPSGIIEFSNTNKQLAYGVAELVRSLGAKASVVERQVTLNGKDCGLGWRVFFYLKGAARMPRKAALTRNNERTPGIYINSEPCGVADTVCIEVDSPNHLFLAGESMTPTHNSIYTSVVFPTHFMGRFRSSSLIVASYGSELPRKFGRRARSMVQQPLYHRIFGSTLSEESKAADEWALSNGSEWMAAGILTGITGNRADGVIWDDLIKGREQADSEIIRQKTWDAYVDDLLTRKKPKAFEIGVTTRWHEDDVAGRILPEDYNGESGFIKCRDGNEWYVVCLPAECERKDDILGRQIGDILWPEWFNKEMFAPFKRNPRTWSSLYQQRPAPDTGVLFKGEWLKPYDMDLRTGMPEGMVPGDLNVYGASDYAVTQEGNYTVHVVVGIDSKHNIYLLDLWRGQETSDVWIDKFCDLCKKWKPIGWAEESGQIKSAIGPFLVKRMRERSVYVARAQFPSTKSKRMRAQSIIGRMAQKGLYCPIDAPWFPEFRRELLLFDAGRNDDQVDAMSLVGQVLDKMIGADKSSLDEGPPKVLSTNPAMCTLTLTDLFEDNERAKSRTGNLRIH